MTRADVTGLIQRIAPVIREFVGTSLESLSHRLTAIEARDRADQADMSALKADVVALRAELAARPPAPDASMLMGLIATVVKAEVAGLARPSVDRDVVATVVREQV